MQVNESVSEEDVPELAKVVCLPRVQHFSAHCQLHTQRARPNQRISGEHLYIRSVACLAAGTFAKVLHCRKILTSWMHM